MRSRFFAAFALSAAALLGPTPMRAQAPRPLLATPSVRVTAPVNGEALVTLKGNTHPMAQARYDQGAASSSLATGTLTLLLNPSAAQQSALRQYMGELQDPSSPNYRKWLTPAEYGASFGIADSDLQTVEAWLQGQGFKIESVPASRTLIQFSGTTGQVAQAFHTSIHSYLVGGVNHVSNATDPQIPAALAPVIAGVSPLNDFRPRPMHVLGGRVEKDLASGEAHSIAGGGARAEYTGAFTSGQPLFALGPADAATIYDSPNSMNLNYTGSTQLTGAGVNIGTVNDSDLPVADYINYRKLFLNESAPPSPTLVVDGADPGVLNGGDAVEAVVDAQLLAALAPGANLYFYSSASDLLQDGVYDAALRAVEDNNVALLSVSFGACEANEGASGNAQLAALWQQAAAQGITVSVSTGDNGSAACDPGTETTATRGLAVSGFASTPYDIAVGGTEFDALSNNFNQYVSAAAAQSASTTYGADFGSALGYIPENPWNDSISNNPQGAYTTNIATQYSAGNGTTYTSISAGSGGVSSSAICPTGGIVDPNTGSCVSTLSGLAIPLVGYPIPSFQQGSAFAGTPLAGSTARSIPDVSLFAASGAQHQAAWAFCSDNVTNADPSGTYTDCQPAGAGAGFKYEIVGGTSTSAPAFTGMLGLVIQSLGGKRLGLANNVLYNLAATQYGTVFHDVTAGNISVPCKAGNANCGSNGFLAGYNAGTNYDLATGLGSVDVAKLVSAWDSATFTPTSVSLQINGAAAPVSAQHGTSISFSASVTPSSAGGNVSVTATTKGQGGAAVNQIIPLTSGSGTVQSITNLPGGSYSLQAYYSGDATHAPSTSSVSIPVIISPEVSAPFLYLAIGDLATGNIQQNPAPTTAQYGAYGYAYVSPANANALSANGSSHGIATGTATLANNGATLSTQTLNSEGVAAFPLYTLTPGSYSFSASYSGDLSYNASKTTSSIPLTISKATTTLTVHTGAGTVTGGNRTLTVELDTDSAGSAPTGAVSLTVNGKSYPSSSVQNAALGDGAGALIASFTLPTSAFQSSSNHLAASYAGDGNYNGSSAPTCSYTPTTTTAQLAPSSSGSGWLLAAEGSTALCSVFLFTIPARRRAWRSLLVLFLAIGILGAIGCGGSTSSPSTGGSVPITSACAQ